MKLEPTSQIIISENYTEVVNALKEVAPQNSRFELFIKEDSNFLVTDANEVIAKAHLSSKEPVFICIGAKTFSDVVQNRLLKIIEEPPKNKIFIVITPLKSALLPTIKSRLIITNFKEKREDIELELNFNNLDLKSVYDFAQANKRLKPQEATAILEQIVLNALASNKFNIDQNTLGIFTKARQALDLGSPADFILTTVLLKLLAKKVRK